MACIGVLLWSADCGNSWLYKAIWRNYQTTSGSNRLQGYSESVQIPGSAVQNRNVTYSHNAAGALTKKGDNYLHYGADARIAKASLNADPANALAVGYTYNAMGQRLLKSDARLSGSNYTPITQQTLYAEDGIGSTVLGQYGNRRSASSAAPAGEPDSTEVIYLPTASGPMPIAAQINGRLYAIDSDHLNTPRRLSNQQGQVAWQWLITGFGETAPTKAAQGYAQPGISSANNYAEAVSFELRYPGQQWDEETGLSYNLHRYYDAVTGRYTQADPIGLEGGWNRYSYVGGNPLSRTDRLGLATDQEIRSAVATLRCANPGEFDKLARSITMADMGENGAGMTDWSNNITLNSNLYGDSKTPVMDMIRSEFLQTFAHEMLHVNQGIGGKAITRIRMGNPLGVLHRQLDAKAEAMITRQLLDQYNKALQNGDSGCSCTR